MKDKRSRVTPAYSPERRENQLVSLAVDLAEKQLRDGTATSQVITHYLKLGTQQNKLEVEKLQRENELLTAKTENMKSMTHLEDMFNAAMKAMTSYSGEADPDGDY